MCTEYLIVPASEWQRALRLRDDAVRISVPTSGCVIPNPAQFSRVRDPCARDPSLRLKNGYGQDDAKENGNVRFLR
jgi:hypothetical protein